ncbi:MAG: transglycosylase domain-containing protein [Defluviitaleaceae bacterium]|nr:transglycosylase domain-containing protein [Defluviitaleaceae bacterium]
MNYSQENNKKRMKQYKAGAKKVRNKVGYTILRVVVASLLIAVFAVGGAGVGFYLSIINSAPDVRELSRGIMGMESLDTIVLDAHGNQIAVLDAGVNRIFAEWDDIPQHLKDAAVAIEDERFFEHNGIDVRSMGRAVYMTLMHDNRQGASTITQQLIKNLIGVQRNTVESKLQEQHMAVQFEAMLVEELGSVEAAKNQILHEYLNIIYLGHGNMGVQAAARFYLNKDVSELTISESAMLISITRFPWQNSPIRFPDHNRDRQVATLEAMLRLEMITEAEFIYAYNDPVFDRVAAHRGDIAPDAHIWHYFVDAVIDRLYEDFEEMGFTQEQAQQHIFHGGLRVYTTMDPHIQGIVDAAFLNENNFPTNPQDFEYFLEMRISVRNTVTGAQRHYTRTSIHYGTRVTSRDGFEAFQQWARNDVIGMGDEEIAYRFMYQPQPQSSMVILDHNNGHVVAIAGQRGEKQGNRAFCRATYGTRQPGSVFKIFAAYAPGIDLEIMTAATGIDDVPHLRFDYGTRRYNVWPRNWFGGYRGWTHVRRAVEMSYNVVAVHAYNMVGGQTVFNYLQNFGFTTLNPHEASHAAVVLGGLEDGVTNLEITAAMGAIANGGILNQSIFYTKVLDREGNILIDNRALDITQVLSRNSAYLLTDIMRGVMTGQGTAGVARFPNMDMAGKTGTTQNGRDVYFVAYTPYFTAGVWVGHDRTRDLSSHVTSARPDTRLWRYVMEQVHQELENQRFERPPGFTHHTVCARSGFLATPSCTVTRSELFAPGTVPIRHCHVCISVEVEIETGLLPSQWTPASSREVRNFITRDRSWMDVAGNIGIGDAHLEAPTAVSTFFNPFVDSEYNFDDPPADYHYYDDQGDTQDGLFMPPTGELPAYNPASGEQEYAAGGQPPQQQTPPEDNLLPPFQPPQNVPPPPPTHDDRPPINWPTP